MSTEQRAVHWLLDRGFGVLGVGVVAAFTALMLGGCLGNNPKNPKVAATTDTKSVVPDACQLLDNNLLVLLLGGEPTAPRSEGSATSEWGRCTWLAPSWEHPTSSLIVNVLSEGLKGISDQGLRDAYTGRRYKERTLEGRGSCRYVSDPHFKVCVSLSQSILRLELLKRDTIISLILTAPANRELGSRELAKHTRIITNHLVTKI